MKTYPHLKDQPTGERDWHQALIDLARYLRSPEGCPWDQKQSALDFARFQAGETAEYIEALESADRDHMREECGDALFILLASVAAAESEGLFTYEEVLQTAHAKMIRRHDHVFGDTKAQTPEEAIVAWEKAKAKERAQRTQDGHRSRS